MSAPGPRTQSRDPYATLGIQPDTPFNEVKAVYRRLVRELHPDVNPDDPTARERFDAVQNAFEAIRALQASSRKSTAPVKDPLDPTGGLMDVPPRAATGTAPMSSAQMMSTGPMPDISVAPRTAEHARPTATAPTRPPSGSTS